MRWGGSIPGGAGSGETSRTRRGTVPVTLMPSLYRGAAETP